LLKLLAFMDLPSKSKERKAIRSVTGP
jgi:hypothetical protein